MARRKKLKFAEPLPADRPGENESQERFMDRMAARGNVVALTRYRLEREDGRTHKEIAECGYKPEGAHKCEIHEDCHRWAHSQMESPDGERKWACEERRIAKLDGWKPVEESSDAVL